MNKRNNSRKRLLTYYSGYCFFLCELGLCLSRIWNKFLDVMFEFNKMPETFSIRKFLIYVFIGVSSINLLLYLGYYVCSPAFQSRDVVFLYKITEGWYPFYGFYLCFIPTIINCDWYILCHKDIESLPPRVDCWNWIFDCYAFFVNFYSSFNYYRYALHWNYFSGTCCNSFQTQRFWFSRDNASK